MDDGRISRRGFVRRGAITAGGAAVVLGPGSSLAKPRPTAGFGGLVPDRNGLLDLPRGFRYRVVQTVEDRLSNGARVPGDFDGMIAVAGRKPSSVTLVRNHELRPSDITGGKAPVEGRRPYDPAGPGGTTAVVVGPDRRAARSYVASSGTLNNCAGGGTPWGTWLTCEEDRTTGHGYVFEADPRNPQNERSRTPIRGMGYFSHEAVDIDPRTGIAYLTEDDFRGSIPDDPNDEVVADLSTTEGGTGTRVSYLYRYLPKNRARRPGALQQGGRLQVMKLDAGRNFNADLMDEGQRFRVRWINVNPEEPHEAAEAAGATRFNRLEGCHFAGGAYWFDDTAGGEARLGQVFRYLPATNTLELFFEARNAEEADAPDNVYVTPWGDLFLAEDGDGIQRVMGVTPDGRTYTFARNRLNESEFAGPCFSPSGRTFFVNIQDPGHTFAIWGPFKHRDRGRQRRMAAAEAPWAFAPRLDGETREAADRHGMSHGEAAAFERLGVPLA